MSKCIKFGYTDEGNRIFPVCDLSDVTIETSAAEPIIPNDDRVINKAPII